MKIKAVLYTSYEAKSGLYPIRIRIIDGQNNRYLNKDEFDYSVRMDQVELLKKTKEVVRVKNHPQAAEINQKIIEVLALLGKKKNNGDILDANDTECFYSWYDRYVENIKNESSDSRVENFGTAKARIKRMYPTLKVKQIKASFIDDLKKKMFAEIMPSDGSKVDETKFAQRSNYIYEILSKIKKVVGLIVKYRAMEYHDNPFLDFKGKHMDAYRERLNLEEVETLERANLTKGRIYQGDNRELARDMFVFSFYCGGIRFADLCRLNKKDFKDGRLLYIMNKTGVEKNIELCQNAVDIIEKYNYQFPTRINWKVKTGEGSLKSRCACLNLGLRRACKIAGVKGVSFHTARHSIADHAAEMNLTDIEAQGILGHKRLTTTVRYMKPKRQTKTDQGMQKLFPAKVIQLTQTA